MTKQEMFDKVAEHLLKQGGPAWDDKDGACKYRAPNGRKCAAGCLIPDNMYRKEWEGSAADCLRDRDDRYPLDKLFNGMFARTLQNAHDDAVLYTSADGTVNSDADWLVEWKSNMRRIADSHNLNTKALDKTP